jgi:hypothetical protein
MEPVAPAPRTGTLFRSATPRDPKASRTPAPFRPFRQEAFMSRSIRAALTIVIGLLALSGARPAMAQEFFMIFNGRVTAAGGVTVATGDRVVASIDGQNFVAQVNPSGVFEGLTIIRSANTPTPVSFAFRKGDTTYALVLAEGDTTPIAVEYAGFNNPLAAAFSPTTVNGIIGPRISGGGGDGDGDGDPNGNDGDSADVDGDGVITTNDAKLVLRFIVGMREGVTDAAVFDVTGDGRINTDDVVAILRREGEDAVVPEPPAEGEGES